MLWWKKGKQLIIKCYLQMISCIFFILINIIINDNTVIYEYSYTLYVITIWQFNIDYKFLLIFRIFVY